MAELDKVAVIQEDYRDLLVEVDKPQAGGQTLEEETTQGAGKRYGENSVVNMAVALHHITQNEHYPRRATLRDAIAILDYLDTLGMEVRFKRNGES